MIANRSALGPSPVLLARQPLQIASRTALTDRLLCARRQNAALRELVAGIRGNSTEFEAGGRVLRLKQCASCQR